MRLAWSVPAMDLGPTELLVILGIVVLLFGVGRIGELGGELGRAIQEFRRGLRDEPHPGDHSEPDPRTPSD